MATKFRLVKSETIPLTLELATSHMSLDPSPTERPLDASRVKYLRQKIDEGLFVCPSWAVVQFKKKSLRMNGNHSSHALCDANGTFPAGLSAHVDTYSVDTPDGLADLFRQFDARKSSRSSLDVSAAYQGLFPDLEAVKPKYALLAIKGVAWYRRYVEGLEVPSGDDIGELFKVTSLHPFVLWIGDVFSSKCGEMARDPIVAALHGTFLLSESESKAFWKDVSMGGVQEGSAAKGLATVLLEEKEMKDASKKLLPAQLYGVCVQAWKCFRTDNTPKGRFSHSKGKPLPSLVA